MQNDAYQIRQIIGRNIEERRQRLRVTQEQFSETLGVSVQTLSALENGSRFALMDTYLKIADALHAPLLDLFRPEPSDEAPGEALRQILADRSMEEINSLLHIMTEIGTLLVSNSKKESNR